MSRTPERTMLVEPFDWLASPATLPGLGPKSGAVLAEAGVRTVLDLALRLPRRFDDLREPLGVSEAIALARPSAVAVSAKVRAVSRFRARRRPAVRLQLEGDDGARLDAFFFFAAHGVLALTVGTRVIAFGTIKTDKGARMIHPDVAKDDAAARGVRVRYPRLGVTEVALRKAMTWVAGASAPEPLPPDIVRREGWMPLGDALAAIHLSPPPPDAALAAVASRRLWLECCARAIVRLGRVGQGAAPAMPVRLDAEMTAALGFELTASQRQAQKAIAADLERATPMRRLLQGDVGSGKTAVALFAIAQCLASGQSAAVLAPTTVLAEQWKLALLSVERVTGKRAVVGTHSLLHLSEPDFGLVVVDEQHRLGVAQRLKLVRANGKTPHLLTMSATPIPRTLALALRGDLETSTLTERPHARPLPKVTVRPRDAWTEIVREITACIDRGERIYVVAPRLEEEEGEISATARAKELASVLGAARVGLLHGRLAATKQREVVEKFRDGRTPVLVATTVVEVGLDVPEATLMIVDGAEHFGLAQLHQLRGRVGRGEKHAECIFLTDTSDARARARLEAIANATSGFDVAHADLTQRGPGDLLGTSQSGEGFDWTWAQEGWLQTLPDDAARIILRDPMLTLPEHAALCMMVGRIDEIVGADSG